MIINNIGINFAGGGGGGSDAKLESKDYNLTANGSTAINPSSGYDGISGGTIQVNVDMQPAYNSGYTEGYASGYTSGETDGYATGYASGYTSGETVGMAEQKALLTSTTITENGNYTRENGYSAVTVNVPQIGENKLNKLFTNTLTAVTQNDLDGVTQIPNYGFYGCSNLKTVDLPASVFALYPNAFQNSGIETLDVSNVTIYGQNVFQGCTSLTGFTGFENYTGSTQPNLFQDCTALTGDFRTNMVFGGKYEGNNLFTNCRSLRSVTWLKNQPCASYTGSFANSYAGCTSMEYLDYTHNYQVPELPYVNPFADFTTNYEIRVPQILYDSWTATTNWNDSVIVNHIVAYPNPYPTYNLRYTTNDGTPAQRRVSTSSGWGDSGFLSEEYDAVTGGTISFYGPSFGVPDLAFSSNTSMTTVSIPSGTTDINYRAFYNCTGLTTVDLPDTVNHLGDSAFAYCSSLSSIDLSNVTKIGDGGWNDGVFQGVGLTSLTLTNTSYIGYQCFSSCYNLKRVELYGDIETWGQSAFQGCTGITDIVLETTNTNKSDWVLLTQVGKNLSAVTFGDSFTDISGYYLFNDSTQVSQITLKAITPPTKDYKTFGAGVSSSGTLYVPAGSISEYQTWLPGSMSGWTVTAITE